MPYSPKIKYFSKQFNGTAKNTQFSDHTKPIYHIPFPRKSMALAELVFPVHDLIIIIQSVSQ